jgi:hypothetical protein
MEIGHDRLGAHGDAFYEKLIAAHKDLSPEESSRLNARLVLIMANMIGDSDKLIKVLEAASRR